MAAPTLVDDVNMATWLTTTTPRDTPTLNWNAGDLILVVGGAGDESSTIAVPTATGLTFAQIAATNNGAGDVVDVWAWTAIAAGSGSSVITAVRSAGASNFGISAFAWGDHDGVGAIATLESTAQSVSLNRSGDNSAVVGIFDGWQGNIDVPPTTFSPSGVTIIEDQGGVASHCPKVGWWGDQGPAGTTAYGVSSESTGSWGKIAVEILGVADAPAGTEAVWSTAVQIG